MPWSPGVRVATPDRWPPRLGFRAPRGARVLRKFRSRERARRCLPAGDISYFPDPVQSRPRRRASTCPRRPRRARRAHRATTPRVQASVSGSSSATTIASEFRWSARLATATAALMFALIVVGSVVRTTGSGLACPDWPLCHGRWIPPFQFNILVEWFHRLIALVVGLGLLATAAWTMVHRETRARLGGLAALSLALYLAQALLGALTVWRLLNPNVVSGHLAVALLLFVTLLSLALVARHEAAAGARPARAA